MIKLTSLVVSFLIHRSITMLLNKCKIWRKPEIIWETYIWGEKGISDALEKLKNEDYGRDLVLASAASMPAVRMACSL